MATASVGVVVVERRIPAAIVSQRRRILAVGAHPDDLELACGATLAKLVDTGREVRGLVMSDGEQGGDESVRPEEAQQGAIFLELTELQFLGFPDTKLVAPL